MKKLRKQKRTARTKKIVAVGLALFTLTLVTVSAVALFSLSSLANLKPAKIVNQPQRSLVYAADGSVIGSFFVQNREPIPIKFVPQHFQDAVVAVEDRRFYKHKGVDLEAIMRAMLQNLSKKRISEGGSTLTQQYVKNVLIGNQLSMTRKIKEAYLAMELERKYTKKQILEAYINTVYFGHGAYGVEAAAETYFGKRVQDLTLAESALIAGLPKSPQGFSPYDSPEESKRRQESVLDKMVNERFIGKAEAVEAKAQPLIYTPLEQEDPNDKVAPYFVEYVKQQLLEKYGKETVFSGGLKIYTTLDTKMQKAADTIIRSTLNLPGDPTASIVAVDPKTGHIKTMSVGRDFKTFKYNVAAQGRRQPGSSFKVFVLVAALEKGMDPKTAFPGSSPINIPIPNSTEVWTVNNAEGSAYGPISLWDATLKSVNAVFAQVIMKIGPPAVVDAAKRMGVTSELEPYPAIAIGGLTDGVSPLEMASSFGTLATGGDYTEPIAVTRVLDRDKNVIMENKPAMKRVVDPKIAGQATQILSEVIAKGTGMRANIGRPAAGKTGTAENYQDAWFVGYTPDLSTAVWMGHAEAQIQMRTVHDVPGYGGIIPATMWGEFMAEALKDVPPHKFPPFTKPDTKPQPTPPSPTPPTTWPSTTAPSTTAPPTTAPPTTVPNTTLPPTTLPHVPPPTEPPPPTTAPPPTAPPTTGQGQGQGNGP
ncbi:MAG: transglycosylase domain-containing protein [Candidatus Aquicultorales bacterium]